MAKRTLGPYIIDRRLGHGGMGTVYAGVHDQTGQWAAIKVLAENLSADPRFRERFQGEVETLKMLNHANIVKLMGYGEEDGQLFFVMELVEGLSLEANLQAGQRFPWQQVVDIAVQVCAALKHAHDHGVIHRDLKPANLLITADGTVKLTDFGIAKLFGVSGLTMAGSMIGTPDYMAPEQTQGHPATARSDLYSLGCVMFALITGKPPFTSPSLTKIIDRVRTDDPPPLRQLVSDVPEPMERVVAQLLRKDPSQRIATPKALANLLRAMQHALTSKALPIEPETVHPSQPSPSSSTSEQPTVDFSTDEAQHFRGGTSGSESADHGSDQPEDHDQTTIFDPQMASSDTAGSTRQTRFTVVPASESRRETVVADPSRSATLERWTTIGIAVVLLVIIGSFVWAFLPPSADRLYGRIEHAANDPSPPIRYTKWMEEFLERFPDDARVPRVYRWQQQTACRQLQQELQVKLRGLTEPEQRYLEGMQWLDEGQVDQACDSFQQILQQLADSPPAELGITGRRLLERTQYLIEELDCDPIDSHEPGNLDP
ncbi:MAG: serine/threonine protein kinase [Planctomycetaceae bacterium]|nr:MAG: serine/threonine protein kinase [Planctomycetaceae bacterium]